MMKNILPADGGKETELNSRQTKGGSKAENDAQKGIFGKVLKSVQNALTKESADTETSEKQTEEGEETSEFKLNTKENEKKTEPETQTGEGAKTKSAEVRNSPNKAADELHNSIKKESTSTEGQIDIKKEETDKESVSAEGQIEENTRKVGKQIKNAAPKDTGQLERDQTNQSIKTGETLSGTSSVEMTGESPKRVSTDNEKPETVSAEKSRKETSKERPTAGSEQATKKAETDQQSVKQSRPVLSQEREVSKPAQKTRPAETEKQQQPRDTEAKKRTTVPKLGIGVVKTGAIPTSEGEEGPADIKTAQKEMKSVVTPALDAEKQSVQGKASVGNELKKKLPASDTGVKVAEKSKQLLNKSTSEEGGEHKAGKNDTTDSIKPIDLRRQRLFRSATDIPLKKLENFKVANKTVPAETRVRNTEKEAQVMPGQMIVKKAAEGVPEFNFQMQHARKEELRDQRYRLNNYSFLSQESGNSERISSLAETMNARNNTSFGLQLGQQTSGSQSAGDILSSPKLKGEQETQLKEQMPEASELKDSKGNEQQSIGSTRLGEMSISNISIRRNVLPGLTRTMLKASSSEKPMPAKWQKHSFELDDGKNIQMSTRNVDGVIQVKLASSSMELTKLMQKHVQEIKSHLEQECEINIDLQFENQEGQNMSNFFGDSSSSNGRGESGKGMGNNADERTAPKEADQTLKQSVRKFGYNQMEWTV
ncbi:MAG: hypothetical protein FH748_00795 [Balneolaceae bacterium]|nr:hypothetical protein [Balneolaceae bacterium]